MARKYSYEIFLLLHRGLAVLATYGTWTHLSTQPLASRLYQYCSLGGFGVVVVIQVLIIFCRYGVWRRGFARATITKCENSVLMHVALPFPLCVKAGQYVYVRLWSKSVGIWSFAQSHPFIVTSWSDSPQDTLDFFIEPRGGLTRKLLQRAGVRTDNCSATISGPYGTSFHAGKYAVVVLVASNFGIAAQLPYLSQLMHGYNSRKVRTRRVHLIWQLDIPGGSLERYQS